MKQIVVSTTIETFLDVRVTVSDDIFKIITHLDKHSQAEVSEVITDIEILAEEQVEKINEILYETYDFTGIVSAKTFGGDLLFEA